MKKTVVKEYWEKKEFEESVCDVCDRVGEYACQNCGKDLCHHCATVFTDLEVSSRRSYYFCPVCAVRKRKYDKVLAKLNLARDKAYQRIMRDGVRT